MLDALFTPLEINGKKLRNRTVVPAMVMNYCNEDGTCTERFTAYHETKAKGGFGMIITEDFAVSPGGRVLNACLGYGMMNRFLALWPLRNESINREPLLWLRFTMPVDRPAQQSSVKHRGLLRRFPVHLVRICRMK